MLPTYMVPSYLIPVYQCLENVRVRTAPVEPETKGETPKANSHFPGCKAWRLQVALAMSEMENEDGSVEREVRRQSITIWSPERPNVSAGDWVRISGLMAGAVDGKIFLQATGVEKLEGDAHELL